MIADKFKTWSLLEDSMERGLPILGVGTIKLTQSDGMLHGDVRRLFPKAFAFAAFLGIVPESGELGVDVM